MRSRRRFAPCLEQLETRVVLSRLTLMPVSPPRDTATDSEEAVLDEPVQDQAEEEPRGDFQETPPMLRTSQPSPIFANRTDPPPSRFGNNESSVTTTESDASISESDPAPTTASDSFSDPRTEEPRPAATWTSQTLSASPVESEPKPNRIEPNPSRDTDSSLDNDSETPARTSPTRSTSSSTSFTIANVSDFSSPEPELAERTESHRDTPRTTTEPKDQGTPFQQQQGGILLAPESGEPSGRISPEIEADRSLTISQPAEPAPATTRTNEAPDDEADNRTTDSEPEALTDAGEPASNAAEPDTSANASDQVFAWSEKAKAFIAPTSTSEAIAVVPVALEAFVPAYRTDGSLMWDTDRDFEDSESSATFPTASQALAVGLLAVNAPHWMRQLSVAWGREEFAPSDAEAILASRTPKSTRRRRGRKVGPEAVLPSGKSYPSSLPQDSVFAESCFLSLLDYPAPSGEDLDEHSFLDRAWLWTKVTAVFSTAIAVARMMYSRLPNRLTVRPKPAQPRYTGPTLWQ